jgi:hypothetical protein
VGGRKKKSPDQSRGRKQEGTESLFRFVLPHLVFPCFLVFPRAISEDAIMRVQLFRRGDQMGFALAIDSRRRVCSNAGRLMLDV